MLGTCAEYDWSTIDGPLVEASSPLAPATLYGIAKDALRRVALAYSETQGVELAWGRVFLLYGPHEKPARLVPSVIHSLLNEQPIATGGGSQVRDLMHVEDVAGAIIALLDSSVVGAVNIASGIEVAVAEVVEEIVKLAGHPDLVCQGARPDRPGEPAVLVADVSRLRDEVGFRPRWGLGDGLAATVRWWEAQERGLIPPAALCKDAPPCSPLPAWPVRRR
jgi:nucleoside-diphosphate-sugar epimerase